ncbi:hypothetical protein KIE47_19465 [Escherichia coli]|nr:hypothetical protein [Escherichia coli]MCQ0189453.1 hypothetical protein [Escherichia coli]MCQ0204022.1 hypothetical protein [Escherichia coli]
MNDIISIISLLSIYIFGLAVIAYTFADIGRTAVTGSFKPSGLFPPALQK